MKPKNLESRVLKRLARKGGDVFLRDDFSDLGGYDQVGRVLRHLVRTGQLGQCRRGRSKLALHEDWSGAKGLAEDVRRYGQWMRDEAQKRIGHLYPPVEITAEMAQERPDLKPLVGQKLTVIAWLWARTVKSPNPAYSHVEVPLASTFILSTVKVMRRMWSR